MFDNCPLLHEVDLSFCTQLTHCDALSHLSMTVRTLSLCGLQLIDTVSLIDTVTRLTNLTVIRLCGVPAVTDDSLEQVSTD